MNCVVDPSQGRYQGLFPVKCNHDRELLEAVVGYGQPYMFGLEAGSKPELLLAISLLRKAESQVTSYSAFPLSKLPAIGNCQL